MEHSGFQFFFLLISHFEDLEPFEYLRIRLELWFFIWEWSLIWNCTIVFMFIFWIKLLKLDQVKDCIQIRFFFKKKKKKLFSTVSNCCLTWKSWRLSNHLCSSPERLGKEIRFLLFNWGPMLVEIFCLFLNSFMDDAEGP